MQTALATAPNSAIPAGLRKKAYDSTALSGITKHAAGVLHVAPDGDILLLRRAGKRGVDNYVGHWALPGGGVEEGETPEIGAARENMEEIGQDIDPAGLKDLHKQVTPNGMAFHTFARPVETKFSPVLNEEHSASGWFSLGDLPQPMHPAVESLIRDRIGAAAGISEDDAAGLGAGLAAWAKEPEVDESTAAPAGADSAFLIAMDRDSVREKTRDGRLIIKRTHISKANVCPYRGKEIPGWKTLGLDPDKIYNLLRDPDELQKAAPTLNGVQLLIKHIPVSATEEDSHRPMETVGSVGSDAVFDGEYLDNSLYVNAKAGIEAIETNAQRELSAGYHYKPDMTPGNFRGTAFDGVMRDIVFNHVALVEDGRAGPDVVVGDEALKEQDMAKVTRFGAMTLSITAASIAPLLAMDSRVTLPKDLFAPLTTKNFKDSRAKLLAGVRTAIDGKLRKGMALDASMEQLAKVIEAFSDDVTTGVDEPVAEAKLAEIEQAAAVQPAKGIAEEGSTYDAEPFKTFLREKGMGEDDIMKACDMMPKPALDSEETPEEKEAREKKEKEEKAANDAALAAKDAEMKDMVTKPAMDAAIQTAVKQTRETERGIRAALADVHPWVGDIPASMAFDSGADVYRHALVMRGVDGAKTLHADALLPILKTLPKSGARAPEQVGEPALAMDAVNKAIKFAPGLEHISTSL